MYAIAQIEAGGYPASPVFWKKVSKLVGKIFFKRLKKVFAPPPVLVIIVFIPKEQVMKGIF